MIKILMCISLLFCGCYTCPKDISPNNSAQIKSTKIDTVYLYDHPYYILYLNDYIYRYDYLRYRYNNIHLHDNPKYFVPDTQKYYERKEFEQRYNKLNRIDKPTQIKPTQEEIQKEKRIWEKRKRIVPKSPIPTEKEEDKDD